MKNFYEECNLKKFSPVVIKARELFEALVNEDKNVRKVYDEYFDMFNRWRQNDITVMREEIENAKVLLKETGDNCNFEGQDFDDRKKEVEGSTNLLDKSLDMLNMFSRSPPKR